MKKINKNYYDDMITYENIYNMWNVVRRTCKNKRYIFEFSLNLNTNLNYIYTILKEKRYRPSKYNCFLIFEPKYRLVMSQTIQDKIVNHFITNYYLIPLLDKSLIDTNVATRKNKGSSDAMVKLKSYYNKLLINNKNKEIYCLKLDIKKYFYSIDHDILINKLKKKINNKDIINIISLILKETNKDYVNNKICYYNNKYNLDIPKYINNTGLSIGAMSSQFLAIFYLNDIDHYIKEKLRCKYYIRYMDDFIILDYDIDRLKNYFKSIEKELNKLNLKLNNKSNIYKSSNGYIFLGYKYKIINNKLYISSNNKTYFRIRRKLNKLYIYNRVKYVKSLSSSIKYFSNEKVSFKMKLIDIVNNYKVNYSNCIVIIKDGIFYKVYNDDAKIIWYFFNYKYINDCVSFGNIPYDRVIDKLKKNNINFIVIDKNNILNEYIKDINNYNLYLELSLNEYNKYNNKEELYRLIDNILDNEYDKYIDIKNYLLSIKC